MYNQEDVTLVTVNFNNRMAMQLMLQSYVKYHYKGQLLKAIVVDNGSKDDSYEWLKHIDIPFTAKLENWGHEQALNSIFDSIETKYALICDTDCEFLTNVVEKYLPIMDEKCKLVGEYISKDQLNAPVKPRVGAWFYFVDIGALKEKGMKTFRSKSDWSYDVLSECTEFVLENGFTIHHVPRLNADIDKDIIGMEYEWGNHYGKLSWDVSKHMDREHEIKTRMDYIITQRLPLYKDVDLRGKFTL